MNNEAERPDLVCAGAWGEVAYAIRANGTMEAQVWLEAQSEELQAKFDHLFRRMAEHGSIWNIEHFRKLRDGIFEFKRDGHRLLCFQQGKCWRLTHHYHKGGSSNKCPPREIERALTIREEHLSQFK